MKAIKIDESKSIPMVIDGQKEDRTAHIQGYLHEIETAEELIDCFNHMTSEAQALFISSINAVAKSKALYKAARYLCMDEPPETVPTHFYPDWCYEPVKGGKFSYRKEVEKLKAQAEQLVADMFAGKIDMLEAKKQHVELQAKIDEYTAKADEQAAKRAETRAVNASKKTGDDE